MGSPRGTTGVCEKAHIKGKVPGGDDGRLYGCREGNRSRGQQWLELSTRVTSCVSPN